MHRIEDQLEVNISTAEAWDFFSRPQNLKKLTPNNMGMEMLGPDDGEMYPGMVIRYRVKPLFGIALPWASEITQVEKGHYFIDSMIEGPFSIWHHQHFFEPAKNGTIIKDIVHYKVPLGPVGELFHPLLVKNKVQEIFRFRKEAAQHIFGS